MGLKEWLKEMTFFKILRIFLIFALIFSFSNFAYYHEQYNEEGISYEMKDVYLFQFGLSILSFIILIFIVYFACSKKKAFIKITITYFILILLIDYYLFSKYNLDGNFSFILLSIIRISIIIYLITSKNLRKELNFKKKEKKKVKGERKDNKEKCRFCGYRIEKEQMEKHIKYCDKNPERIKLK